MRLLSIALSACAFSFACAGSAAAAIPFCSFSAAAVAFGSYNPLASSPATAAGMVTIDCVIPTTIVLSLSTGSSNGYSPRTMVGPGPLNYNLYADAGDSKIWGDGTGGTVTVSNTFGLFSAPTPVYGAIFPLQNALTGSYADAIVVTATY